MDRPLLALARACLCAGLLAGCGGDPAPATPPAPPTAAAVPAPPGAPGDAPEPAAQAPEPAAQAPTAKPVELPVVRIRMPVEAMKALEGRRREALETGILVRRSGDYVEVEVATDDGPFGPARVRLKGDWMDHLERDQKWSMRMKVKGEHSVLGMRVFSLQHPDTRAWLSEWQLHDHMKREGVLALRYRFVKLEMNGLPWGIYALEEHFSKELLEAAERREGVIIKLDEGRLWSRLRAFSADTHRWTLMPDDFRLEPSDVFRSKKTARSPSLAAGRDAAIALLQSYAERRRPASQVFQADELARFLAIYELWSAQHGVRWHNLRFYFDPVTTRLSPIAFDAHFESPELLSLVAREAWSRQALEDPRVAAAFVQHLQRISTEAYLDELEAAQAPEADALFATLRTEFEEAPPPLRDAVRQKATLIRRALAIDALTRAKAELAKDGRTLRLSLLNTTRLPVEVLALRLRDGDARVALPRPLLLAPYRHEGDDAQVVSVQLPPELRAAFAEARERRRPPKLEVLARYVGLEPERAMKVQVMGIGGSTELVPDAPSMDAALSAHPFLERVDSRTLRVRPGSFGVRGDLILPEGFGLRVGAGTTLRFAPGAVMVVNGPLELAGGVDAPVELVAARPEAGWGGLLVHDAPSPSRIEHARIAGAHSVTRGGWTVTGGVTFLRSPLALVDSRIEASKAEDMLNVIGARVQCTRSVFEDGASDGFDGDWVDADFDQCEFRNVRGDAFDVSGSRAQLRGCAMAGIADKAVSAGEESSVIVESLRVAKSKIAIAAKDLARVEADGVTLSDVTMAFAAFQKKAEYGPGTLIVNRVRVESGAMAAISLIGSQVKIDGKVITASGVAPPELGLQALERTAE